MKILNANGNLMITIDANFFSISERCMLILLHILKCMCVATRCWVLCSLQDLLPGYHEQWQEVRRYILQWRGGWQQCRLRRRRLIIGQLFIMVLFSLLVFLTISLSRTSSFASFPPAFIPSPPGSHIAMSIFITGILSLEQQVVTEAKHVTVFLSGRQIAKVGRNNGIMGCILDTNSYSSRFRCCIHVHGCVLWMRFIMMTIEHKKMVDCHVMAHWDNNLCSNTI